MTLIEHILQTEHDKKQKEENELKALKDQVITVMYKFGKKDLTFRGYYFYIQTTNRDSNTAVLLISEGARSIVVEEELSILRLLTAEYKP